MGFQDIVKQRWFHIAIEAIVVLLMAFWVYKVSKNTPAYIDSERNKKLEEKMDQLISQQHQINAQNAQTLNFLLHHLGLANGGQNQQNNGGQQGYQQGQGHPQNQQGQGHPQPTQGHPQNGHPQQGGQQNINRGTQNVSKGQPQNIGGKSKNVGGTKNTNNVNNHESKHVPKNTPKKPVNIVFEEEENVEEENINPEEEVNGDDMDDILNQEFSNVKSRPKTKKVVTTKKGKVTNNTIPKSKKKI
jgi:hypothetical protein